MQVRFTVVPCVCSDLHVYSFCVNVFLQPRLLTEGEHRFVVETGIASLLMNYEEMLAAGEAVSVLVKLQNNTKIQWGGDVEVSNSTYIYIYV